MPNRENDMDGSLSFPGSMPDDAWLERLLTADAARQPHIDDNGFSLRVLKALPAPQRQVSRWLVPAMTAVGSAVTAFLTPAGDYLTTGLAHLVDLHHFSPSSLLLLVPIAVLYACSFEAVRNN